MATNVATRVLYVLSGLPFSGKTTVAKTLLTNNALLIERDRFLEDIKSEPTTLAALSIKARAITEPVSRLGTTREANAFNDVLTAEYCDRVANAIRGSVAEVIIVDGTHLQRLSRLFICLFPKFHTVAMVVETPPEVCVARLRVTPTSGVRSSVTPDMIQRMATVFERPTTQEGFNEVRLIVS